MRKVIFCWNYVVCSAWKMFNMKLLFWKWLKTAKITQNKFYTFLKSSFAETVFLQWGQQVARLQQKFWTPPRPASPRLSLLGPQHLVLRGVHCYTGKLFAKFIKFGTHFKTFKFSPAVDILLWPHCGQREEKCQFQSIEALLTISSAVNRRK